MSKFIAGETATDRKNARRSERRVSAHVARYRAAGGTGSAFSDQAIHFDLTGRMD